MNLERILPPDSNFESYDNAACRVSDKAVSIPTLQQPRNDSHKTVRLVVCVYFILTGESGSHTIPHQPIIFHYSACSWLHPTRIPDSLPELERESSQTPDIHTTSWSSGHRPRNNWSPLCLKTSGPLHHSTKSRFLQCWPDRPLQPVPSARPSTSLLPLGVLVSYICIIVEHH